MARYGLANHVFVCTDEEYVVVLDLKQDRYFTLDAARTAALASILPGWPAPATTPASADSSAGSELAAESGGSSSAGMALAAEEAAGSLVQQGWLLELPAVSKEATPVRLPPPETELLAAAAVESAPIGARAVLTFVFASVFAKLALRFWPFERVIHRVARRKAAHPGASGSLDVARARQLVDVFGRLRVFLFSHREKCLHDSLAQLEFLARYGVFPSWVFGVRARPFVAHCWVQYEDIVFNDTIEHVGGYAPIMVV
jgi:Transglutaminase-like superfamily